MTRPRLSRKAQRIVAAREARWRREADLLIARRAEMQADAAQHGGALGDIMDRLVRIMETTLAARSGRPTTVSSRYRP